LAFAEERAYLGCVTAGGKGLQCCANRFGACAVVLSLAWLLFASSSFAASGAGGPTRSEYVQQVEPICKAETQANRSVLRGVEEMIQQGKLQQAAPRLGRAAAALRAAVKELAKVPRPAADVDRLARWLQLAGGGGELLGQMARKLQQGDREEVQRLSAELLQQTKRANAAVVGFNFDYCRANPARFV
jgi:hypothetical protein